MLVLRRQKKYTDRKQKNTLAKNINNLENDLIPWFFLHTKMCMHVVESFSYTRYLAN